MTPERKALYMAAPSFQGGHSLVGGAIADALRVPFPITMRSLEIHAKAEGLYRDELWPWLAPMRAGRR